MPSENTSPALVSTQPIDPAKLEATIEQMYFQSKNVTPEQKTIFAHAVQRTGLDPIIGQIRPVIRETKNGAQMAIQTSIDGYRLIADRTGLYAGSDDPVFEEQSPQKDFSHPAKATVTVWKLVQGQRCGFTASARWNEYFPKLESQQFMWRKMPYLMLGKCAEALALRKAFPADLSGIYTDDEMQQAEPVKAEAKVEPPKMTVVNAMSGLTSCPSKEALVSSYCELIKRHQWTAEERAELSECYVNRMAYVTGTKLSADKAAFTNAEGVIVAIVEKDPDGWAMIEKPKGEKPVPAEEQAMADAERAGQQADSQQAA